MRSATARSARNETYSPDHLAVTRTLTAVEDRRDAATHGGKIIFSRWDASKWDDLDRDSCRFGMRRQSSEISGNRHRSGSLAPPYRSRTLYPPTDREQAAYQTGYALHSSG